MLGALTGEQRSVLFAHECSHLRHHLYFRAVELAAAANLFLGRIERNVHYQLERWADEDAAVTVNRTVAAQTLARTSALTLGHSALPALGLLRNNVAARIRALDTTAPQNQAHDIVIIIIAGLSLAAAITLDATHAFSVIMTKLMP